MKITLSFILCSLLFILAGCKTMEEGGWLPPEPRQSKYLQTTEGYFELKINKERTDLFGACSIGAVISNELPRPAYAKVVFEMPKRESPWVVETEIKEGQSILRAKSGNSREWEHYQGYRVQVFIFSDEAKQNQIDYLEQFVRFERPPIF